MKFQSPLALSGSKIELKIMKFQSPTPMAGSKSKMKFLSLKRRSTDLGQSGIWTFQPDKLLLMLVSNPMQRDRRKMSKSEHDYYADMKDKREMELA